MGQLNWLDNESQALVMKNVYEIAATKEYRLSTIRNDDHIYIMSLGRII